MYNKLCCVFFFTSVFLSFNLFADEYELKCSTEDLFGVTSKRRHLSKTKIILNDKQANIYSFPVQDKPVWVANYKNAKDNIQTYYLSNQQQEITVIVQKIEDGDIHAVIITNVYSALEKNPLGVQRCWGGNNKVKETNLTRENLVYECTQKSLLKNKKNERIIEVNDVRRTALLDHVDYLIPHRNMPGQIITPVFVSALDKRTINSFNRSMIISDPDLMKNYHEVASGLMMTFKKKLGGNLKLHDIQLCSLK